jgi:hypothetical protein
MSGTRIRFIFLLFVLLLISLPLLSLRPHRSIPVDHPLRVPAPVEDPARYAVIKENLADPCLVTDVGGKHYTFATGNATLGINVQIASALSNELSQWTIHRGQDALPVLKEWVFQPNVIAQV